MAQAFRENNRSGSDMTRLNLCHGIARVTQSDVLEGLGARDTSYSMLNCALLGS